MQELLGHLVDINDIARIVYFNDNFEVIHFKHIDIECVYGEYLEIAETDELFQKMLQFFQVADLEQKEIILYQS